MQWQSFKHPPNLVFLITTQKLKQIGTMRNTIFAMLLLTLFTGCMSSQYQVVDTNYSYKGNFKNYKSFSFQNELNPNLKDNPINESIETAIKARLELQGYTYVDEDPSLFVAYRMFYKDFTTIGFKQPTLEEWLKNENLDVKYDPVRVGLKKGTLMIVLRDNDNDATVWQGYASTFFGNQDINNERYVNQVVRSIFDQYRIFANDLLADNRKRR